MSRKVTGILAYCSIIGWLIALIAGDREGAKFHLNQGFVYAIFGVVIAMLSGIFNALSWWLFWPVRLVLGLANVALVVLSICGIVFAAQEREVPLPLGNLFTVV